MLDVELFRSAPFTSSILANFLSIVGLIGFIFFISQHLQLVLGLSPLAAGLVTLPGAVLSMVAGIAVVPVAKRFAPHVLMIVGLVLVAAGFLAILLFRHDLTVAADHRVVPRARDRGRHLADHLQRHHRRVGASRPSPVPRRRCRRRRTNSAPSSAPRRSAPSSPRTTAPASNCRAV